MTARRDRRKGWLIDIHWTHADGRRERIKRVSPVQTKRGAEEYERQLREELLNPTPKRKEVPTVEEFQNEFLTCYAQVHNKENEVDSKRAILRRELLPALGKKRLDEVTVRDVDHIKSKLLGRGLKPATVNNVVGVLSKMIHYAQEIELIDKAPRLRMLRVPPPDWDFLDDEEEQRLLDAARKCDADWYAMLFVALRTGGRYGELCELRWGDVDLKAGRLMFQRSWSHGHLSTPKNGKAREIPLSPETVRVLKEHRHLRGELVFCKEDGGRHIHRRADVAIKKICRRAGLRPIGWHVLRHTFASHLVMRGRSLKEVQELLGHADYAMTMRYSHLAPSVKRDAVATLDTPLIASDVKKNGPYTAPNCEEEAI